MAWRSEAYLGLSILRDEHFGLHLLWDGEVKAVVCKLTAMQDCSRMTSSSPV